MDATVKKRQGTRIRETGKDRVFNAFNLVFWILVLFIVLYPLWLILIASVSDPDAVLQARVLLWPVDFSLMGYEAVFQYSELWGSYANSVFYTVVGSALSVMVSLAAAYALSRSFAGKKIVNLAITFTMFFSGGLIPIFLNVRDLGLYNTRAIMILMNLVSVWNLMVARTYIQTSIPNELYEAAVMDGAGRFRRVWSVTLPSIMPTIVILLIMRIGNMMTLGWEKIVLLYNQMTYETSDVISTYVYRRGLIQFDYSFSAAVGFFNSIVNFLLLIGANALSRKVNETSLW